MISLTGLALQETTLVCSMDEDRITVVVNEVRHFAKGPMEKLSESLPLLN